MPPVLLSDERGMATLFRAKQYEASCTLSPSHLGNVGPPGAANRAFSCIKLKESVVDA